tara:strand:+ start:442 stop:675 length:234 start_codon:yes stop_codon:yes gene_type:complete
MKYKNTTPNNIFAKVNGRTVVVAPDEEIISENLLPNSGLTAVVDPVITKVVSLKPVKKPAKKSVNTNEFTTTNKTKD